MKVPGQCLLQVNEPTSDDNDENDGDNNTVVVDETCCSETEGMLAKKKCSTRSGQSATPFAFNCSDESLNPKQYRKVLRPK